MQYSLRHPVRVKKVTLKVEPPDRVIVSAPKRVSKKVIEDFVTQNEGWIKKQLIKLSSQLDQVESDTQIMIFGIKYNKMYIADHLRPLGISIEEEKIIFNFPHISEINQEKIIKKELKLFLKKSARTFLEKQLSQYAKLMNVKYQRLTLREQKTRWGSCSGQDRISLNWRLVHYPPEVINYVIVHELAHLVQRNHSRQFWQLVAQYDPEYSEHRSYLRKYGVTHE
ncbi:MAG: hypothetical protein XD95_0253 [Microgenomates bacterium 39_7]|nr:MAG: hypothetical protein XD95_0253 [Microgenomates bacterium 39_7]